MWEYLEIGKILKPYRHTGEILATIRPELFEDIESCKAVFLKVEGLEIPFFLEYVDLDNNTCIIKLEEINSPEEVKKYNGQNIYLRKIDVRKEYHDSIDKNPLEAFIGFTIYDKQLDINLSIKRVEQYPQQLMAHVDYKGDEVLIPLVEAYIINIEEEDKRIIMSLPEGIL